MANEVDKINGVTKREHIGNFVYFFPTATINVSVTEQAYVITQINDYINPITAKFSDVTDKFGQSEIVGYVDELARRGFFFDSKSNIFIAEQTEAEKFAAGTGSVKTDFESIVAHHLTAQTKILNEILKNLQHMNQ